MFWVCLDPKRGSLDSVIVIPEVVEDDSDVVPGPIAIRVDFHRANEFENCSPSVVAMITVLTLLTKRLNCLRRYVGILARALD